MTRELAMRAGTEVQAARPYELNEVWEIAERLAKSGLFPGVQSPQAAFTLCLLCQADGLHPIEALRRYHVIEGRPSMRADAIQAEFQARGGVVRWVRSDDQECEAQFSHPTKHPEPFTVRMDMRRMTETGVCTSFGKDGKVRVRDVWRKWPDAMLRARVIGAGVRAIDPGVIVGIATEDEAREVAQAEHDAPELARRADREDADRRIIEADPFVFGQPPGVDARPFVEVVKAAVDTVNASANAAWDRAQTPLAQRFPDLAKPALYRHLMLRAINLGLTNDPPPPTAMAAVPKLVKLYESHRATLRSEINAFLKDRAELGFEVIEVEFEVSQPEPAPAVEDASQDLADPDCDYPDEPGSEG